MLAAVAAVCLSASMWAQSESRMSGHANDGRDARRPSGHIGLQLAHPEDVRHASLEFRNLKVKPLK